MAALLGNGMTSETFEAIAYGKKQITKQTRHASQTSTTHMKDIYPSN